jgi:hypothetical protein
MFGVVEYFIGVLMAFKLFLHNEINVMAIMVAENISPLRGLVFFLPIFYPYQVPTGLWWN